MGAWRVVVADNHPIFRIGLRIVLESSTRFEVVGEAVNGAECIAVCKALQPDVALIDVHMPNGNGIEATDTLHQLYPQMVIIGITAYNLDMLHPDMLRAGASSLVSKETDFEQLIEQIAALVEARIDARLRKSLPSGVPLTRAEHRILILLAAGYDRKMISENLSISYNTVKMHCRHLYRKLGVSSVQEAIKIAVQYRLLS